MSIINEKGGNANLIFFQGLQLHTLLPARFYGTLDYVVSCLELEINLIFMLRLK